VRRLPAIAFAALLVVLSVPARAAALEVRVSGVGVASSTVVATFEMRDLLKDKFLQMVEQGRAVFVQIRADLWEDRRVADRLALTSPALNYRIDRGVDRGVIVTDQFGNRVEHPELAAPLPIRVELGPASALVDDRSYYVHAEISAATVAERDIQQAGAAILGDPESAEGLAGLGRFVFNTLLRIGQYLDTARAEATSGRLTGIAIRSVSR
jgi:hypothetical protein